MRVDLTIRLQSQCEAFAPTHGSNSGTQAGCRTIQLDSDTVYPELPSERTRARPSPPGGSLLAHADASACPAATCASDRDIPPTPSSGLVMC